MAGDRAVAEERVLEQVREWLPRLTGGREISIRPADHTDRETPDGVFFTAELRQDVFVCRRGGGSR